MKNILAITILILLLSACGGSGRKSYNIDASYWPPVEREADSLVAILEVKGNHLVYNPADTVLVNRIDSIGRARKLPQLHVRAIYWRASLLGDRDFNAMHEILDSALALCDTSAYMYDYLRLNTLRYHGHRPTPELLRKWLRSLDVYASAGDSLHYATALVFVAQAVASQGDTAEFLNYYTQSTDILHRIGAREIAAGCDFFLAKIHYDRGDLDMACRIIDTLRTNPCFFERASQPQGADLMYYTKTRDHNLLLRALHRCDSIGRVNSLKPLIYAKLAENCMDRGLSDSMRFYKDALYARWDSLGVCKKDVYEILVRIMNFENKPDSAALFQQQLDNLRLARKERALGKGIQESINTREIRDLERKNDRDKGALRKTAFSLSLLLAGAVTLIAFGIRIHRRRLRNMDRRLLQAERRTSLAKAKGAEKDRAMAEFIENAEKSGDAINPVVAKIKARLTPETDWQRVELLFAELNPAFTERLRKRFPQLSPAENRLACLIYLGLDTKHIARLLNIAPDSVKKTRQRLRAKLDISPETDLHEFIAGL